jgi:hypothetical protein
MYTEKEAKEKCCPVYEISKLLGLNGIIQFQMKGNDVEKHLVKMRETGGCLASDCMMWRWDDGQRSRGGSDSKGFCGIAGLAGKQRS